MKIKLFLYNLLDKSILKDENKKLKTENKRLNDERIQLIDLKNRYLADLRCKNLQNGRMKKQLESMTIELNNK